MKVNLENIEFTNKPPTVEQCPDMVIKHFARSLVYATKQYQEEKAKNG